MAHAYDFQGHHVHTESCILESPWGPHYNFLGAVHKLYSLWQYGLWSFQTGGTKLERFLLKNQHTQRKLLNFEIWINGELSKSAKISLSKSIFYAKII